ncbi:MAG TPA: hypothetical protein VFQ62_15550 [Methylomirabilota bacterium]|nr:hypothetical protein [Methylomirabilota bacterium]
MSSELRVEHLLGRVVVDSAGRRIGRIEEVQAEREGPEWVVQSYVLGVDGLLERLAAGAIVQGIVGTLAGTRRRRRIGWDELDLNDPDRPRLRSASAGEGRRLSA